MSQRFYVSSPLTLGPATLEGSQAHHLAAVCRLGPGDQVFLFNGDGREYRAEVTAVAKRQVDLMVVEATAPLRELPFSLVVAAPLPKGDRGQFLVEKLTELGATTFIPLRTRRSVVHAGEGKLEKLTRTVIEASKQCGRNVLMTVEEVQDGEGFWSRPTLPQTRWVAHPTSAGPPVETRGDRVIAIGPEGGWTDEEVAAARAAGWQLVGLGPRILRVETAAVALAAFAVLSQP
jgi:16S rRNA (uracil1498-N3)-methyltransferase